jgi:hypothetical protein
MRKEDIDAFAKARPFQPFELRLVDGQRFRSGNVEQFIFGRGAMSVLTPRGTLAYVDIGLISTIGPLRPAKGRRTSGRNRLQSRSKSRTSASSRPLSVRAVSSLTAAPSPFSSSWPLRLSVPRTTCSQA